MSTMKLPANYASISEEEMVYLDGGASDAYNSFLNVGKVFNAIARIFSGASSIINNVNVIYQSFLTLGDLSSHRPDVFFLRSLNCLLDMRLGMLSLYSCNL